MSKANNLCSFKDICKIIFKQMRKYRRYLDYYCIGGRESLLTTVNLLTYFFVLFLMKINRKSGSSM